MYRIFYGDDVLYDPIEPSMTVTDASLTHNINAPAYLDFSVSPDNDLYNDLAERDKSVVLYWDSTKLFEGKIESIDLDLEGYKKITCISALDYLNDSVVRPYSTVQGERPITAPNTIAEYFAWLIAQHNANVGDFDKQFTVGVNQGDLLSPNETFYRCSDTSDSTASVIESEIIDTYGGYLFLRYDGSTKFLDLYADVHDSNTQIIDFGVNILDFTKTSDTSSQYTALYLRGAEVAKDDDQDDKGFYVTVESLKDGPTEYDSNIIKRGDVIYSDSAVTRYGYKETLYEDRDITDATQLLKAGIVELNKLQSPTTTIEVRAIDLTLYMDGYTHLAIGQAVRVRSKPHDIDEYLMVTSIELDLQNPENTEYVLGTSYDSMTGQQSSYLKKLNANINHSIDAVTSMGNTVDSITGTIGDITDKVDGMGDKIDSAVGDAQTAIAAVSSIEVTVSGIQSTVVAQGESIDDLSTQVKQNADSIDIVINDANSAKEDASAAKDAADEALDTAKQTSTLISLTSSGVRVGKNHNGSFTGYSALVNSNGSFDILNSSSQTVTSFGSKQALFYDPSYSTSNPGMVMVYDGSNSTFEVGTPLKMGSSYTITNGLSVSSGYVNLISNDRGTGMASAEDVYIRSGRGGIELAATNGNIAFRPDGINAISFHSGVRFEVDGYGIRHIYKGSSVFNPGGANGYTIVPSSTVSAYGGHQHGDVCVAINGDWSANRLVVMGVDWDNAYNVRFYNWAGNLNSHVRIDWCVFALTTL